MNISGKSDAGPSVLLDHQKEDGSSSSDSESNSSDTTGNKSPAQVQKGGKKRSYSTASDEDKKIYGPVIPELTKRPKQEDDLRDIGPVLPPSFVTSKCNDSNDDEEDVIGPQLPGMESAPRSAADEFERRAKLMKNKLLGKTETEVKTRESWMTEIPDSLGSSLLGLPVAKSRFGDGKKQKIDRAGWTETPQDKEKRLQEGKSQFDTSDKDPFEFSTTKRDQEMEAAVQQLNSDRQDSLLDLHREKLSGKHKKKDKKEKKDKKDKKKKKKKEKDKKAKKDKKEKKVKNKPTERIPFDRDRDLQANVFDDAKRKALIKRSQQLNSRFQSSGKTGQFL